MSQKGNDQVIHDIMLPIGRRHVGFGSNPVSMEILGILIHKSLMQSVPTELVGVEKYKQIEGAFLELFRSIVYWLQFGFNAETRNIA